MCYVNVVVYEAAAPLSADGIKLGTFFHEWVQTPVGHTFLNVEVHTPPPVFCPSPSCLSCLSVPVLASLSVLSRASVLHLCCLSCQITCQHTPCQLTQSLGNV